MKRLTDLEFAEVIEDEIRSLTHTVAWLYDGCGHLIQNNKPLLEASKEDRKALDRVLQYIEDRRMTQGNINLGMGAK
jgi:hypothetical protein